MLNLDTHILIYALSGDLQVHEKKLLEDEEWSISAVVYWELAKLSQLGRIDFDLENREVLRILSRIHLWPITLEICQNIKRVDVRVDPADEIIGATSITYQIPLLTRDKKLKASSTIPLLK